MYVLAKNLFSILERYRGQNPEKSCTISEKRKEHSSLAIISKLSTVIQNSPQSFQNSPKPFQNSPQSFYSGHVSALIVCSFLLHNSQ